MPSNIYIWIIVFRLAGNRLLQSMLWRNLGFRMQLHLPLHQWGKMQSNRWVMFLHSWLAWDTLWSNVPGKCLDMILFHLSIQLHICKINFPKNLAEGKKAHLGLMKIGFRLFRLDQLRSHLPMILLKSTNCTTFGESVKIKKVLKKTKMGNPVFQAQIFRFVGYL